MVETVAGSATSRTLHSTLKRGLRLLSVHKRFVLLAYSLNLGVALLVLVPFADSFQKSLGKGLHRTEMVEGIDYDWYTLIQDRGDELLATFSPSVTGFGPFLRNLDGLVLAKLAQLPPALLAAGFFYILLNSYVSAAVFGCFATGSKRLPSRDFFRIGGEFVGRFFRLTLLSLLSFFLLFSWILLPLLDLVERISENASTDRSAFRWEFAAFVVTLVLLSLLNLVFDYTKIVTATENRTSVFLSFLSALTFCVTYAAPVCGLYVSIASMGALWTLLWVTLEQSIPQTTWVAILAAITCQQICFAGRLAFRFFFYSAQTEFFLDHEMLYREDRDVRTVTQAS